MANKLGVFYLLCLSFTLYSCLENQPYVINDFQYYTGLKSGYKINKIIFKANQSYINLTLEDTTRKKLEKDFDFKEYDSFKNIYDYSIFPYEIRLNYDLINLNIADYNYTYYIADGEHADEYLVILLSKKTNEMIYCENFRDIAP